MNKNLNFTIEELSDLSGKKAKIYTVRINGSNTTIFEDFLAENIEKYPNELQNIIDRLQVIGKKGAFDYFFKLNEGKAGDGLVAFYETPDKKFRLYCIKYSESYIILGSGGLKTTRTWNEDPILSKANLNLQQISKQITARMKEGDLKWSDEEQSLIGNLTFSEDDEY